MLLKFIVCDRQVGMSSWVTCKSSCYVIWNQIKYFLTMYKWVFSFSLSWNIINLKYISASQVLLNVQLLYFKLWMFNIFTYSVFFWHILMNSKPSKVYNCWLCSFRVNVQYQVQYQVIMWYESTHNTQSLFSSFAGLRSLFTKRTSEAKDQ